MPFIDDEERCNSARVDGLLFLGGGPGGEASRDWLDSACFLGVCGPWGESSKGGMFVRTAVHFAFAPT